MEDEELKAAASPRLLPPALEVAGSRGQQDVVGMPIQAEDRGADGLFNVLAHPPGIFRLKVINGDELCSAAHSKFAF